MSRFPKAAIRKLQQRFFPSAQDKVFAKWFADRGDATCRLHYDLDAESLVLDLGGYEGQWASDIFAMYGCRVEVFEPVAAFANGIARRFARNHAIKVNQFGLGGRSRTESISLCSDGSSIFLNTGQTETVPIVDIAEWLKTSGVSRVDLMKLNIEGGEYELLERLISTGLVAQVRDIQVQFHRIGTDFVARRAGIQAALSMTHQPTYQYPFVWENWRRLGDARRVSP